MSQWVITCTLNDSSHYSASKYHKLLLIPPNIRNNLYTHVITGSDIKMMDIPHIKCNACVRGAIRYDAVCSATMESVGNISAA